MDLSEKSDEEILRVATPIMDNLMDGSTEINHKQHTRDFTDRAKRIVTKETLEKQCKKYQAKWGYFADGNFVRIFRLCVGLLKANLLLNPNAGKHRILVTHR